MSQSDSLSLTLPGEIARTIREKVATGAYASAEELVCEGIRAIKARDADIEQWLRDEVLAGHAEYLRDTSRGVRAEDMLDTLKARRAARQGG